MTYISTSQGLNKNHVVSDLQQKQVLSYLEGHADSEFCVDASSDDKNVLSCLEWRMRGFSIGICQDLS